MKKQYTSYKEMIATLQAMVGEHPDLIRLQSIGQTWENRPIMLVTLSQDVAFADQKPAMLYTGTIHAREWIGIELALKFIRYILDNYTINPQILEALTRSTLYIVPCLNPDGFEYSRRHFSFWRKNRRDNGDGNFGVDLNRNFEVRFRKGQDTGSNTYGGPEAFSEPETRAIRDFVEQHPNITLALDYHSQGNVFFPAHKFNHEAEAEGTDLNIICANMAREINRVTGRRYGIHRGKPPANLIHGSGREYYYSKGIMAIVVEVGSRNIPDYLINMSQSIDENIPALLWAFRATINYSDKAPPRVSGFSVDSIAEHEVSLSWEYPADRDVYFELYRSDKGKSPCTEETLVAITQAQSHTDVQLNSSQRYFYNIRAVDRVSRIKSPFAPELRLSTLLDPQEFSRTLFPQKSQVGYVGEKTQARNPGHFGHNSLFAGINQNKGICYGVIAFDLDSLPADIHISRARFSIYPMNRVNAKIEKYGEWSVSILDPAEISDITDYAQIASATPVQTLGKAITSERLTQGIWINWNLSAVERGLLQSQLDGGQLLLRIEGPEQLPRGNDSQMMQFDIGYGRFGGGIHYRPNLELIYSREPQTLTLQPQQLSTISREGIKDQLLQTGFDDVGDKVYGQLSFNLSALPNPDITVITDAWVELVAKNRLNTRKDLRFTLELAEQEHSDFVAVQNRQKIEYVGYEISNAQLKSAPQQSFIFDSYCRGILESLHTQGTALNLILRATTASKELNALIDWQGLENEALAPRLVIDFIERRKHPLPQATAVSATVEQGMVKISWNNPSHPDFVGCYVVRNRFHPPRSPLDGVKLYAGRDEYTYDNFGNANIPKYYSVFSYDNVPNYSTPSTLMFSVDEVIPVDYDDLAETQEEEEDRLQRLEENEATP